MVAVELYRPDELALYKAAHHDKNDASGDVIIKEEAENQDSDEGKLNQIKSLDSPLRKKEEGS